MIEHFHFENCRGELLSGVLEGASSEAAVICCHGMLSSKDGEKVTSLTKRLRERGLWGLRFDFSGRGESEGASFDLTYSRQMQDLDAAVDVLFRRGVKKVVVFGSSMGGAVALLAAARDERIVGVATIAAVAYPGLIEERYPVDIAAWRDRGYIDVEGETIGLSFLEDALAHDVVSAVSVIQAPLLVIHGIEDRTVPVSDADDIAAASCNVRLHLVDGADHRFSNLQHLRPCLDEIVDFCQEVLQ